MASELAWRVRRLTDANAAHYFDANANKRKRVYRDSRCGAAKVFGGGLVETLADPELL
jgi:hypothetical protein